MPENPLLAQRYRLLTEVGRGGMGTVWHARDEVLGRDVAVKEVILPHGFSDEEREIQHKRTFREARIAARLSHPGVVTVFDVVEEDGRPWIVMELIRARSLQEQINREGPLPPRRVAEIGRQMLGALATAHLAGILHRDVKPSNVLVTTDRSPRAVLTDFGIARAQSDATLTQTGMLIGSPAYIAPERARGRPAVSASDLWSLGVTLYAAVEGKSPFERPDAMATLVAVLTDEPAPAPNAGPLRPVIEGLLRKDPAERLTAGEAAAMLGRVLMGGSGGTAPSDDAAGSTRRFTAADLEGMPAQNRGGRDEPGDRDHGDRAQEDDRARDVRAPDVRAPDDRAPDDRAWDDRAHDEQARDDQDDPDGKPVRSRLMIPGGLGAVRAADHRVGPIAVLAAVVLVLTGYIVYVTLR